MTARFEKPSGSEAWRTGVSTQGEALMSATPTYPGVYIEEVPSGVHTIAAVATSVTALIGRAERGPTDVAQTIRSFADFEKIYGGLWADSMLGFAVRDFFLNGGSQAIIVRLYRADPGPHGGPVPLTAAPIAFGDYRFVAASEGTWGVRLRVTADLEDVQASTAASLGLDPADLFNLTVLDRSTGASERFLNLTFKDSARRADAVLAAESTLLRWDGTPDATRTPAKGTDPLSTLEAALATARQKLIADQKAGQAGAIAADRAAVSAAQSALDTGLAAALARVSDGLALCALDFLPADGLTDRKGLYALEQTDLFNILCIPPYRAPTDTPDVDVSLVAAAASYCEKRRAMLIVDAPKDWITPEAAKARFNDTRSDNVGTRSRNAALYFPRLIEANPLHDGGLETFAACGAIAGLWAATDTRHGVWKAPAGLTASLAGVAAPSVPLADRESGGLNPLGINCLRTFPAASCVVWGARTLSGADALGDEYRYVPVRRTALFIEESLYRGTQWVAFEPNNETLWAQIRLGVGAFMCDLFRQGAFQGSTPKEAYFVKCDQQTTTQDDIDSGVVNIVVGFAPLKPAEFVIIRLRQIAGRLGP